MEGRLKVGVCLVVAVLGVAMEGCRTHERRGRLPEGSSLLLVTIDTTRRDVISPYGADEAITPNLQRFADAGTIFWHAYAQANVTNPSHLSMMSGLAVRHHGIFNNRQPVPEEVDTLPEAFARAGFETAAFPSIPHAGEDFGWRGFEHLAPAERALDAPEATGRILDWLDARDATRPFFVWLHYWDPHTVYDPPEDIRRMFYDGDPFAGPTLLASHRYFDQHASGEGLKRWLGERRDPEWPRAMYKGEVHEVDRQFGRLDAALAERGLVDTTAVIVIADHGESLGEHDIFYGHPGLYETQLQIPFLARIPGFPAGVRVEVPVSHLDVAPTVAELFGVSLRHELVGTSLVPWLAGEAPSRELTRDFIHEHAHNLQVARRRDRWKLIWPVAAVDHLPSEPLLYDLQADPSEERNLSAEHPEIVGELKAGLDGWISLGRVMRSESVPVDPEALERLRALGYVH